MTYPTGNFISSLPAAKVLPIFCGVCEYDENGLKALKTGKNAFFSEWKFHVNTKQESENDILKFLGDSYYKSFVSSIFPGFNKRGESYYNQYFNNQICRYSHALNIKQALQIKGKDQLFEKEILIEYFDVFLFPGNLAIYSFKCDFGLVSYDEISLLVNYIRNNAPHKFAFIGEHLKSLKAVGDKTYLPLLFGNKLKSFLLVEMDQELLPDEEKDLLFDLSTCSPVGSAAGFVSYFKPAVGYKEKLWNDNLVNVFDNWKAVCLFDSFTGLFRKDVMNNFVWENAYFNLLFIHSVFVKHYLFMINKEFFLENSNKQKLEEDFYGFDNYFNFRRISYNFLPQIIYDKIRLGFDIEVELSQMQTSIEQVNAMEQSVQDKKINKVLTLIAFLTLFSVLLDASSLIDKLVFEASRTYQVISGSLSITVFILIAFLIFRRSRRKRKK